MNLRKSTSLHILGLLYIVLYKAIFALFPSVRHSEVLVAATSTLWLLATLTLIVFASQFLVETAPRDWRVRYSLIVVIVLTGVIILTRLPLGILNGGGLAHRLLFGLAALLNSVAILMFLFLFSSHGPRESALWRPTRVLIWTVGGTGLLGIVAAGYFGVFVLTGRETEPLWFLQPLSVLLFVATYTATLWFLIRFRQLRSYTDLPK